MHNLPHAKLNLSHGGKIGSFDREELAKQGKKKEYLTVLKQLQVQDLHLNSKALFLKDLIQKNPNSHNHRPSQNQS